MLAILITLASIDHDSRQENVISYRQIYTLHMGSIMITNTIYGIYFEFSALTEPDTPGSRTPLFFACSCVAIAAIRSGL